MKNIRVLVWNEFRKEKESPELAKLIQKMFNIYPEGIHETIAKYLRSQSRLEVQTATQSEPEHGLTSEVLNATDVLIWWGHVAHNEVKDSVVDRVYRYVLNGMGLIVLHSGHFSKIFRKLMGTSCSIARWREAGEKERIWVVNPGHPITKGLPSYIEIPATETFGEYFDIPQPDELVFISWFQGGEIFRSGCCFYRGKGKIFYFRPGHETFPIYYHKDVLKIIYNAVRWAAPSEGPEILIDGGLPSEPLEKLPT